MNADFLILKIQDEVSSLDELREGEALPLGSQEQVRTVLECAFPSVIWEDERSGTWWSGECFSVEIRFQADGETVRSLSLKIRLNPALSAAGWLYADEAELESFLLALCDPQEWSLFEVSSGLRYRFPDEQEADLRDPPLRQAGLVN
jgi:hypothetical protein